MSQTFLLGSDNGLVFTSRSYIALVKSYGLQHEFITPYTPEQNGIIERFFRSLKEECVWQHQFQRFAQARQISRTWLDGYNRGRPHQALHYQSPVQFRAAQLIRVAS